MTFLAKVIAARPSNGVPPQDKKILMDALCKEPALKKFGLGFSKGGAGNDYLHANVKGKGTTEMYVQNWSDLGSSN